MARWEGSPQYQKHLRKIQSMSPEKRAVTQGLIDELSAVYAGADMQKQLAANRSAAATKEQERSLDLSQQRLDQRADFGQQELDIRSDALRHRGNVNRTAEILGWANLPLSGLAGYADMMHKKKLAKLYQGLADRS